MYMQIILLVDNFLTCIHHCSVSIVLAGNEMGSWSIQTECALFEILLTSSKLLSTLSVTDVQMGLGLEILQATVKFQYYIVIERFENFLLYVA